MARVIRAQEVAGNDRLTSWAPTMRVQLVAVVVGLASFVATEVMHYLLVPNMGRRWERLLAEGVSAFVVAWLTASFMEAANQRQEAAVLRMQVISEMNHHIRNALGTISLTTDSIQNEECVRAITEAVDRIEWALREILLRREPISEHEIDLMRYATTRTSRQSAYADREKEHE